MWLPGFPGVMLYRYAMPDRQEEIARIQELIVEADLQVSVQVIPIEWIIEKGCEITEAKELLRHLESSLKH